MAQRVSVVGVLCIGLALLLASGSSGQTAPTSLDLVVVQDDSGSMWEDTDDGPASDPAPQLLRVEAARLVAYLVGADITGSNDRIGFVAFGDEFVPEHVARIPLAVLDSAEARQRFVAEIEKRTYGKGYTDYVAALRNTVQVLEQGDPRLAQQPWRVEGRRTAILFLSDGRPQTTPRGIDQGQLVALRGSGGFYAELKRRGWPVFTVGLGLAAKDSEPKAILTEMATVTGGLYFAAAKREDLLPIYTQIVAHLAGSPIAVLPTPERVPYVRSFDLPGDLASVTFSIVKSDESIRVRVARPGGGPVAPGPDVTVDRTPRFENVTVRDPAPGRWVVTLDGQGTVLVSLITRAAARTATPSPTAAAAAAPTASPSPAPTSAPTASPGPCEARDATPPASGDGCPGFSLVSLLGPLLAVTVAAPVGYLWLLSRAASRIGLRNLGAADGDRTIALTDVPWSWWPDPLRPRIPLHEFGGALGWTLPAERLRTALILSPLGLAVGRSWGEGLLINGKPTPVVDATPRSTDGDSPTGAATEGADRQDLGPGDLLELNEQTAVVVDLQGEADEAKVEEDEEEL